MLFDVKVPYYAKALRHGRTRPGSYYVVESRQVDIPFVSGDEAPVAVEWDATIPDELFAAVHLPGLEHPVDGKLHTRFHEGSHWRQCLGPYETGRGSNGRLARPMTLDSVALLDETEWNPVFQTHGVEEEAASPTVTVTGDIGDVFASIEPGSGDREKGLARLERAAANLIVVDGAFYERCPEPKLVLWHFPGLPEPTGRLRVIVKTMANPDTMECAERYDDCVFSIAEFDEAVRTATRLGARTKYRRAQRVEFVCSEPPLVRFRGSLLEDGDLLNRVDISMRRYLRSMQNVKASDMPDTVLDAYRAVRGVAAIADPAERLAAADGALSDAVKWHTEAGMGWHTHVEGFGEVAEKTLSLSISI